MGIRFAAGTGNLTRLPGDFLPPAMHIQPRERVSGQPRGTWESHGSPWIISPIRVFDSPGVVADFQTSHPLYFALIMAGMGTPVHCLRVDLGKF